MNIGLFGGTFNPIHCGHLLMAEYAREQFGLRRVIFIPTGTPPHRKAPKTSALNRLAMVRLAIGDNRFFEVSDWEIRQGRVVYTYETLSRFAENQPKHRYSLIIGSDSLSDLPRWRRGPWLLQNADFIVVERPTRPWQEIPKALRSQVRHVISDPVPFAGHTIRARVRAGTSIRYQVPRVVDQYIQSHRLYRQPE